MTPSAEKALSILRNPSPFKWYILPLLLIVMYIYHIEIDKKNWNVIFAGLALWGIAAALLLPREKTMKIMGLPIRLFFAVVFSILAVAVEKQRV